MNHGNNRPCQESQRLRPGGGAEQMRRTRYQARHDAECCDYRKRIGCSSVSSVKVAAEAGVDIGQRYGDQETDDVEAQHST